jgi:hypothetical protein
MHPRSSRDRVTDDELVRVCTVAARVACRRMTPRYLKALNDSVEQACCLPSGFDWDRKAAAHAEIVNLLADAAADPALCQDPPKRHADITWSCDLTADGRGRHPGMKSRLGGTFPRNHRLVKERQ